MDKGLVVEKLAKTYRGGKVRALDGVTLTVAPGEVFGIIGPNGAGKTTLFGCMVGFLKPDSGSVTVDGLLPDDLAVHAMVGYLPERLMFDRWMTGRAFLGYHHELAGMPDDDRDRDVAAGEPCGCFKTSVAACPECRVGAGTDECFMCSGCGAAYADCECTDAEKAANPRHGRVEMV